VKLQDNWDNFVNRDGGSGPVLTPGEIPTRNC
jgi:hypothetical protein